MKDFIYPEMMVHVPLCTHKEPENVLILSDNAAKLELEVARHNEIKATILPASIDALRGANDASFEVVLCEIPCKRRNAPSNRPRCYCSSWACS